MVQRRSGTPPPGNRTSDTSRKLPTTTLFQRMGGIQAVKAVVEEFYTRLQNDPKVADFFAAVSLAHLKRHQVEFLKIAFSHIPDTLDVHNLLLEKHKRLFANMGLNETHFDVVAMHFVAACQSHQVDAALIDEAVGIITPLRVVFETGAKKYGSRNFFSMSPQRNTQNTLVSKSSSSSPMVAKQRFLSPRNNNHGLASPTKSSPTKPEQRSPTKRSPKRRLLAALKLGAGNEGNIRVEL